MNIERRAVWRIGSVDEQSEDELAREEPLEIRVNGHPLSVTMRTPGDDRALAAGFLLTEGLIRSASDVECYSDEGESCNVVDVTLAGHIAPDFERLTRHVFASSSCGLCGKATIEAIHQTFPPVTSDLQVDAAVLLELPGALRAAQPVFAATGGLHAAGVFDAAGKLIVACEDVGRHNAVDKVLGHCFQAGRLPLDHHILLVSGRASFEILQKSLAGAIPIVAAVSAPSSLAVQFAERSNQTLVGFLRDGRMNVYASPQRIIASRQS